MFTLDSGVLIVLLTMQREDVLKEAELYIFDLFSSMSPIVDNYEIFYLSSLLELYWGMAHRMVEIYCLEVNHQSKKKVVNVGS